MPEKAQDKQQACSHLWIIDSPQGPTSWGKCRWCGETREFLNSIPDDVVVTEERTTNSMMRAPFWLDKHYTPDEILSFRR
jgi:hypothetical protein